MLTWNDDTLYFTFSTPRQSLVEDGADVPPLKTLFATSQETGVLTQEIHHHLKIPNHKLEVCLPGWSSVKCEMLQEMSQYYFDGEGKAVRPALTLIMARAVNSHLKVRPSHLTPHTTNLYIISLVPARGEPCVRTTEKDCHHL